LDESGIKPRLGELLLADVQIRTLKNSKDVDSALLMIDVEMPNNEEQKAGTDPNSYIFVSIGAVPSL